MASALDIVKSMFPEVTSVVDSKVGLNVEVTKRDINAATVKNHKACAVAVACKRKMHADGVIISINRAYVVKGKRAYRYNVPRSVAREVVVFDRGGQFEAGTYRLEAIPSYQRIGTKKHGARRNGSGSSHNGNLAKRFKKYQHKTENIRATLGTKHAV